MHTFLSNLEKRFKKLENIFLMLSGITVIFAMLLITVDVIMRNIFNKPITGVIEIMSVALIIIVALGFSYVQGVKENIIIEVATNKLSDFNKSLLDLAGYLIGLTVITIITWQCGLNAISSFVAKEHTMGLIKIPLWPSKWLLTIGMATLNIRLLLDFLLLLIDLSTRKSVASSEHKEENNLNV